MKFRAPPTPNFWAGLVIIVVSLNIIAIAVMVSVHERYLRVRAEEERFAQFCRTQPAASTCVHTNNGQIK